MKYRLNANFAKNNLRYDSNLIRKSQSLDEWIRDGISLCALEREDLFEVVESTFSVIDGNAFLTVDICYNAHYDYVISDRLRHKLVARIREFLNDPKNNW